MWQHAFTGHRKVLGYSLPVYAHLHCHQSNTYSILERDFAYTYELAYIYFLCKESIRGVISIYLVSHGSSYLQLHVQLVCHLSKSIKSMHTALFVGVVSVVIIVAWIVVVLLCFLPTHQYLRSNPIIAAMCFSSLSELSIL